MNNDKLYKENEHLIDITIRKNYSNRRFLDLHGLTNEELIQSGRIGLHKACQTYSNKKGVSFQTHAINCIKWTINDESKRDALNSNRKWTFDLANKVSLDMELEHSDNVTVNLYDLVGEVDRGYEEVEDEEKIERVLDSIKEKVSEKAAEIVKLKLDGLSNVQVAKELGVTHQNVSLILRTHRDRIRKYIIA